ncbi:hypothetical protein SAMN05216378_4000 [Paenibacillus catalpae]|uniref:Uncharacterized protein n=1 Tax=Paenibacillus catalpae TaxID=1045775 RepID=A0A1I2D941_9BACL|nr:hypothetical protein [Paenibacillus catalpae]SFE76633.1 hypothetical protein SAMN05216378_4000 [Paenibacillus catalpae]
MPTKIFFSLMLFFLFSAKVQAFPHMTIETVPAPEGNWVYLPEGDGEMKIIVRISHAQRIKVWRVPTGTQQWEFRELICDSSGERDIWTCTWRYDERDTIHDHFVVELIDKDWSMKESLNVTRRHAENHPQ